MSDQSRLLRFTSYPECDVCEYPIVTDSAMKKRHDLCQRLYRREYSKQYQRRLTMLAKEGAEMDKDQKYRVKVATLYYAKKTALEDDDIQSRGEEHLAIVMEEEAILSDHPPQPIHVPDESDKEHWSRQAKRILDDHSS